MYYKLIILTLSVLNYFSASSQVKKYRETCKIDTLTASKTIETCRYDNGQISSISRYTDGSFDGEFLFYDTLGRVVRKSIYSNDRLIREEYSVFYTDNIYCVRNYKNCGWSYSICRYENGQMMERGWADERGVAIGLTKTWFKNGHLALKFKQHKGKSRYKRYYETGQVIEKGWINETPFQKIGKWCYYNKNGELTRVERYSRKIPNSKQGIWEYFEKGKIFKIEEYEQDSLKTVTDFN
jgi:antitoxin component YwqK of YwqJK toxin-antitoxin module